MNLKLCDFKERGLLRDRRGSLYCYWALALLMAAVYALFCFFTPYYLDDWTFMGNWRDDAANKGFSLSGWWRYYAFIRGYDNGRISNALSPISTMISPWKELFPWISGILTALAAVMLQQLATGRRSASYLLTTWLLMIVGLPWLDTIFVRDYTLNYIWGAAVTLALLWSLRALCRGRNTLVLCLLLAIPAGGWHEGFALTTLFGLALLAAARRFRFPPSFYAVAAVYLLSALVFMLSPGLMGRAAQALAQNDHSIVLKRPLVIIAIDLCLLLVLAGNRIFSKKQQATVAPLFSSPAFIVSSGILVSGFLLGFFSTNTLRSYFWPDMGGITLALLFIREIIASPSMAFCRRRGTLYYCALTLMFLFCTLQSAAALVWQIRYARETDEILALLDRSESGTVFYDSKLPLKAPFYTLGIPVDNAWQNPFHYRALQSYYLTPVIGVVPTSLRNATRAETESDTLNLRIPEYIDGHMVYPFVSECGDTLLYRMKY